MNVRVSMQTKDERETQAAKLADLAQDTNEPAILRNIIGQMHGLLVAAEKDMRETGRQG